jgi:hypothetical protein
MVLGFLCAGSIQALSTLRMKREVLYGSIVGPFPLNTFSILLEHSKSDGTPRTGDGSISSYAVLPDHLKSLPYCGLAQRAIRNVDRAWGPASGETIAEQCAQLREFRDKQGRIPEPQWYYGLGVLVHCDDGDLNRSRLVAR